MSKIFPWRVLGVLAVVATVGGFGMGYVLSSIGNPSNTPDAKRSTTSKSIDETVVDVNQLISKHSLEQLADASRFGSFFARTEALLAFLADADLQAVQQLWKKTKNLRSPAFQEEIQNRVIQRWATLDPQTALDAVRKDLTVKKKSAAMMIIFGEWSLSDLDAAIAHAQRFDSEQKVHAVTGIVLAREDMSAQQRRDVARRLDVESVAIRLLKESTDDVVIDAPEREWNTFVRENLDEFRHLSDKDLQMLVEIGHSWVLQNGGAAFTEMQASLPENFSLLETTRLISKELINRRPRLALDFVLRGVHQGQDLGYHELVVELCASWAETDPSKALEATQRIEARSLRRQVQKTVLEKWATPDPYALLESVAKLPENLQQFAREIALIVLAEHAPETVAGMLSDLPTRASIDRVAKPLVSSWAGIDITGTLNWIENEGLVAHRKHTLKELAFKSAALLNPHQALEIALQQPLRANGTGWEEAVIDQVILRDMDTAVAMLSHARPGATRHNTHNFAVIASLFDEDVSTATEVFLTLCELEPKVPNSIDLFSRVAPEQLFETLGVIRSVEIRTDVAHHLLWHYEGKDVFTTAQIDLLREIERTKKQQLPAGVSKRLRDAFNELRKALEAEERNQ